MSDEFNTSETGTFKQRLSHLSVEQKLWLNDRLTQFTHATRYQDKLPKPVVAFVRPSDSNQTETQLKNLAKKHLNKRLPPHAIPQHIFKLESFPQLANGKIDKQKLRQLGKKNLISLTNVKPSKPTKYEDVTPALSESQGKLFHILKSVWSEVLSLDSIVAEDNFFELGGDSILSIHVVSRVLHKGYQIGPNDIFDYPTLQELTTIVDAKNLQADTEDTLPPSKWAPLTPIQNWFFNTVKSKPGHWNLARCFQLPQHINTGQLEKAIQKISRRHDVFRLCFRTRNQHIEQTISAVNTINLEVIKLPDDQSWSESLHKSIEALSFNFDLEQAPLIRFIYYVNQSNKNLMICAHHLVIDHVSWAILKQEFITELSGETAVHKKHTISSFSSWSRYLNSLSSDPVLLQQLDFWTAQINEISAKIPFLTSSIKQSGYTEKDAQNLVSRVDEKTVKYLQFDINPAYSTSMLELLLSAFTLCISDQFNQSEITVDLESHGRFDPKAKHDLSQSIGWFSSVYPVRLIADSNNENLNQRIFYTLKNVKEKLGQIKHGGIEFGLLQQAGQLKEIEKYGNRKILFNYLGKIDSQQSIDQQPKALPELEIPLLWQRHPQNERSHALEIQAYLRNGQLCIDWRYDPNVIDQHQLTALTQNYNHMIERFANLPITQADTLYTPADFPDSGLDQNQLDDFLDSINSTSKSNKDYVDDIFPLSENQIAFLLTNLKSPDSDPGQLIVQCEFVGKLDKRRFKNAWQAVVNKHAALRTTIHWEKTDQPLQVVRAKVAVDIEFKECKPDASDQDLLHNTHQTFGQLLQLGQVPNHQIIIYRVSESAHIMHWRCHHGFIDGWSTSLVLADLIDFYAQPHKPNSSNDSLSTFKDYLKWINGQNKANASEFWIERLSKLTSEAENPTQNNQQAPLSCFESEFAIKGEQLDQFNQLCHTHKLTPSILIQTAWAVLLNSLYNSESLSFTLTLSGRAAALPGIEKIVGQLSTALPVVATVAKRQTFIELAQQIKHENRLLRQYEYLSLGQLSKWGYVATNGQIFTDNKFCRIPDSLVVVENFTPKSVHTDTADTGHAGFRLKQFRSNVVSLYPLTLIALTDNELIRLRLMSNHNQIDASFNAILTDRLKTIVFSALASPDKSLETVGQRLPPLETSISKNVSNSSHGLSETVSYAAPETETHAHLLKIWQETLKIKQKFGIDDNFFNIGGTSLQTVSIYSRIETHFGCALPLASILQAPTIRQLAELIQDPAEIQARHLVKIQTEGDQRPVFGIHAQDVLFYRDISAAMGKNQPFYAVQQLDQEQIQLSQYQNLQQMAAAYIKEIQSIQATGPYQIIGLCIGCTIGYEMAFQLSQQGQQVDSLIMIDPDCPEMVFKKRKASAQEKLTATNLKSLNRRLAYSFSKLSDYPLLYQLAIAKGQLRIARKSLSGPLEKRRAQRRLQNWILNKNYKIPAYLGKITVIQSGEYHQSMQPFYENSPGCENNQTNIDTHVIPGSHTNIFSPPTVYQTASVIKSAFDKKPQQSN